MPDIVPSNPFEAALMAGKSAIEHLKRKTVLYCTDSFEIAITARAGTTKFFIESRDQVNMRLRSRDFIINRHYLQHPETGELFEPLVGHRIKELVRPGQYDVYEVLPFGDEPCWRFGGTLQAEYRIHTKRINLEPES